MITYTLLIWEQVPEETTLYLIPNTKVEKDNRLELLRLAHNNYINASVENYGLRFLNAALVPFEHINDDEYFDDGYINKLVNGSWTKIKAHEPTPVKWRCVFDQYKVDSAIIEDSHITRVIVSGFIL